MDFNFLTNNSFVLFFKFLMRHSSCHSSHYDVHHVIFLDVRFNNTSQRGVKCRVNGGSFSELRFHRLKASSDASSCTISFPTFHFCAHHQMTLVLNTEEFNKAAGFMEERNLKRAPPPSPPQKKVILNSSN